MYFGNNAPYFVAAVFGGRKSEHPLCHSRLVTPKCGDLVRESPPKCPGKTFRFRNYRDNLRIDTPQKSNIDTKNDGLEFGTCISFQTWLYMLDINVRFQEVESSR